MISTPQEIEQTAIAVANWIVYNNRPFILSQENGNKMYLAVLTEEQMLMVQNMMTVTPTAQTEEKSE